MSRLVDIDPPTKMPPEPYGFEFGYYLFDKLPPIEVNAISLGMKPLVISKTNPEGETIILLDPNDPDYDFHRMVDGLNGGHYELLSELQATDKLCARLIKNIK